MSKEGNFIFYYSRGHRGSVRVTNYARAGFWKWVRQGLKKIFKCIKTFFGEK